MSDFLAWMAALPGPALYLLLGIGSALENVVPAVPADTFVALGGILTTLGDASAIGVFVVTWTANVASALAMYRLAYAHGGAIVGTGIGRFVLRPHQLTRMQRFYERFGLPAIFLTRFLPGLRAVVPIFAGITKQRFFAVAIPVAVASAIWHAALVWLGVWAGRRIDVVDRLLSQVQGVLALVAVVVGVAIAVWWWRSRHSPSAERNE